MVRKMIAFAAVATALAVTGCSKCSEQPAADAPAAEMAPAAVETAPAVDPAAAPAVDPAAAPAADGAAPVATPAQ